MEATKNICYVTGEGVVDHSMVTKCFKKFHSGYKNLSNQERSGRTKTVDSKTVNQAIEANPMNPT